MPYLTPNNGTGSITRAVVVTTDMLHIVRGALVELTWAHNWQAFGDLTVEECVERSRAILEQYDAGGMMIGSVIAYATTALPYNCLACDGTVYNRVDYPLLYAALDTAFIVDADTFSVPDMETRVIVGSGGGYAVGDQAGEATHLLTVGELAAHDHTIMLEGVAEGYLGATPSLVPVDVDPGYTGVTGSDTPHNNMQPYTVLHYAIIAL